jgi:hypothetical protein
MNKTQIQQLLEICKANNLNPKNLIQFNKAIKIYKDGKHQEN